MDALEQAWPQLVVLSEVAAAMLLGGLIGYERETANKPAGFRTHMMLAGACALLVGLGGAMLASFTRLHPGVISADPFRLVGGVVTALGFIGAGTIFRPEGQRVEGLTTATSLLFSGGDRRVRRTAAVVARGRCNAAGTRRIAWAADSGSANRGERRSHAALKRGGSLHFATAFSVDDW